MSQQEDVKLEKTLSPLGAWGLALGAMIGWGCFVMPGNTLLPKAGPIGASIGLTLGALMIIVISYSFSYLISKFPVAGGEFVYADYAFGKTHAFICGWIIAIAYWALIPMNGTAVGLVARYILPGPLQTMPLYEVAGWTVYCGELLIDVLAIFLIACVNMRGMQSACWFQTAVAMGLVGSIMVIASVIMMGNVNWSNLQPYFAPGKTALGSIFAVTALAPWAYVGFDCIPQASEEYAFSNKKTKMLLVSSVSMAALMYMIMNIATAIVQPWQQYIVTNSNWATGAAIEALVGTFGLVLLAIAMLCGIISGLNAFYLAGSRLLYSMALADALPSAFSKLDDKNHVPRNGILFMMILALAAPFFGREVLGWLVDMTAVGADMGFAYTTAAAFVMARRIGDKKQMLISGLGFGFSAFFILSLVVPGSPGFLSVPAWILLVVWALMGVGFFIYKHKAYYASTALQEKVARACIESETCDDSIIEDYIEPVRKQVQLAD